jgi:hypothetical protein
VTALAAVPGRTPWRQRVEPRCRAVPEPGRSRSRVPPAVAEATPVPAAAATPVPEPAAIPAAAAPPAAAPPVPAAQRRRVRALNPLAAGAAALLEAVRRHEFLLKGLRNRDLRALLYPEPAATEPEKQRPSAARTRQWRLLRAQGLIREVPKTHRSLVSDSARPTWTALLAARNADTDQLTRCAG